MSKYIVIHRCEDEPTVKIMTEAELKAALNSGDFEGYDFIPESKSGHLPLSSNLDDFPSRTALIIKGEVIVPKPKQKVVEYDL